MTPDELATRFAALADEIQTEFQKEVETVATTGLAQVIQRVSETGKDAKGASFKPYTKRWEQIKRGAVSTAKREGKKKREARRTATATKDKPIGRYRGFVDFTFTGRMLSNTGIESMQKGGSSAIGVKDSQRTANGARVVVAGRTEETTKKMEGNDKNRKGWFRLSEKEITILKEQSATRVARFIENFLTA